MSAQHPEPVDGDDTARLLAALVRSERRQRLLARMARAMADSDSLGEIARNSVQVANEAHGDIARALICRLDAASDWEILHAKDPSDLAAVRGELTRRLDPQDAPGRLTEDVMPGSQGRPPYARAVGPQEPQDRLCIAPVGRPPGIWDKVFVFEVDAQTGYDAGYLDFINQFLDLVMSALLRVDAAQVREAAARERDSLLLQAPVPAALMVGPEHRYRLANDPYLRMVGRTQLVGRTWREVFPELAATGLPAILDRVFASGEGYTSEPMHVPIRKEGEGAAGDYWFIVNLQPLRHSNGDVYGIMSVATDVTAQFVAGQAMERAHAERIALVEELRAANRVKDEFLAMLGHELRNPLAPIVAALQMMKMRGDTATEREQVTIQRQVDHLVRLVDDLLDVARIARGRIELKTQLVDASDAIDRAVEMAGDLFEQRRHHLTVDKPEGGLATRADPTRLAQAVANLLTNAARYTPPEGHVRLAARREGAEIAIEVSDDGIGIDPALLPRIFGLFVQGQRGLDRAEGGLGIGLALVKNLVELHGGRVEAHSEGPGRGSRFTIRLPAANEPAPAVASVMPTDPPLAQPALPAGPGRRVLVVDDNVDAANSLAEVLRMVGHEVAVAHSPAEALQLARAQPATEFAVLDIGLPGMTGYELANQLRELLPACRFVALTGYGQADDKRKSAAAGFDAHMVKPVAIDRLEGVLRGPEGERQ